MYIAGLSADDLDHPQIWLAARLAAFQAALNSLTIDIESSATVAQGTIALSAVSYFLGFTVVTNPVTHRARNVPTARAVPLVEPVTSVVGSAKVASQRRRNLQSS
jgi:hypothetical protein